MLQTLKKCCRCQENKSTDDFCRNKRSKDGLNWECKTCVSNRCRTKEYRAKVKVYLANRTEEHKSKEKRQKEEYFRKRRDQKAKYDIEYRNRNKRRIQEYKKNWEQKNRDNPIRKIKTNLRRRVMHVLKGNLKADKTFALIGCTAEEFKRHLESLWLPGMSWENYGEWHIDHIRECFRFDLSDPEQQRICFHYTNQRPLWKRDNLTRKRT